jgi:hypothetical protein
MSAFIGATIRVSLVINSIKTVTGCVPFWRAREVVKGPGSTPRSTASKM